ncbi:unannotated protein [freshwater metagenome]|uniref:Unannotated protein n=1 Tax=freshwater metagenome TaxID=449393 RepID=A0A6J7LBB5_9ZZZZ
MRSYTVVTRRPATSRTGTPLRIEPPPSCRVCSMSKRGRSTSIDLPPIIDSAGTTPSRSRFHFPLPESV